MNIARILFFRSIPLALPTFSIRLGREIAVGKYYREKGGGGGGGGGAAAKHEVVSIAALKR